MKRTLLLLAALLPAAPALAYQFLQCSWTITGTYSNGCPAGRQETDSCGCTAAAAPTWYGNQLLMKVENQGSNGITAAQFVQIGREAAQAWNNVSCSNLVMDASQTLAATDDARWGDYNNSSSEHGVFFVRTSDEWNRVTGAGVGGALGVTVSPYAGYSCTDREFVDSDILVNGFLPEGLGYNFVKNTVIHEMGHSLGLGHPCLVGAVTGYCSNECQAIMGASGGEYTTPQQDDINALCQLYPGSPGGLGSACSSSSNCVAPTSICVEYQTFKYCTHTCGSCEEGYECKSVNAQSVCVRKGAPAIGDSCTGICETGAVCVGTADGGGTCYQECNPSSPSCSGDDRCLELEGGGGVCVPPGSRQLGEECGTQELGDCAAGMICLIDEQSGGNDIAHCYRECDETRPTSCGSDYLCLDIGSDLGVCLAAARPGQDCEVTQGVCTDGYECTPADDDTDAYTCHRSCDYNDTGSCGEGETCITFVDAQNNPIAGACYPSGDRGEGEACYSYECADGLLCIVTNQIRNTAQCLLVCDPSGPSCPHRGQECMALSGGSEGVCYPAGEGGTATDGGTRDSATTDAGGGRPDAVINPEGKDYLEECGSDGDCKYGICRGVSGYGSVCLMPCDPRLGHYDCPVQDESGCVPQDVQGLNLGGTCQPRVTSEAHLNVGDACDVADGYRMCSSGLCEGGLCLMACNKGECPGSFECDTTEINDPGICRPLAEAPTCLCAAADLSPRGAMLLALGLLLAARLRRG